MNELLILTQQLKTSKPLFNLIISNDETRLMPQIAPEAKYFPSFEQESPLTELIYSRYKEHFSIHNGFSIDRGLIAKECMSDIRNSIATFLDKNLSMRSPTQSKVYRWAYRNMPHNEEYNDILVELYKYMRTYCNSEMKANLNSTEHVKTTIALLEAMMEKNNDQ
jgi:hypothetical protein